MGDRGGRYLVRPVQTSEWADVRHLRLVALLDDAASIAFLDTYDEAAALPDSFWQERTAGSASDARPPFRARQFVATTDSGEWVGTATVLRETVGEPDFEGRIVETDTFHIVGVYLRPEHRGSGLLQHLLTVAADWAEGQWGGQARLYVHAENSRAQRAYAKAGFAPTGLKLEGSLGTELEMMRPAGWDRLSQSIPSRRSRSKSAASTISATASAQKTAAVSQSPR